MSGLSLDVEPLDNSTEDLSCAVRSIEASLLPSPYSTSLHTAVRIIQALFYIIIFVCGTFLNTLVIVLVVKYKKLQTRPILLAFQIAVLNSVFMSSVYMLRPVTAIADRWLFGEHFCILSAFLIMTYYAVRFAIMIVLAIDRYLSYFFSSAYPSYSSRFILWASVFAWTASLVFRAFALPWGFDCYSHVPSFHLCGINQSCGAGCVRYGFSALVLLYIPAFSLPMVASILICRKARKISKSSNSESSAAKLHKQEWPSTVMFFLLYIFAMVLITPHGIVVSVLSSEFDVLPTVLYIFVAVLQVAAALPVVLDPIAMLRIGVFREMLSDVYVKLRRRFSGTSFQGEVENISMNSMQ